MPNPAPVPAPGVLPCCDQCEANGRIAIATRLRPDINYFWHLLCDACADCWWDGTPTNEIVPGNYQIVPVPPRTRHQD